MGIKESERNTSKDIFSNTYPNPKRGRENSDEWHFLEPWTCGHWIVRISQSRNWYNHYLTLIDAMLVVNFQSQVSRNNRSWMLNRGYDGLTWIKLPSHEEVSKISLVKKTSLRKYISIWLCIILIHLNLPLCNCTKIFDLFKSYRYTKWDTKRSWRCFRI